MNDTTNSTENVFEKGANEIIGIAYYIVKNKKYLVLFITYIILSLILLYLIVKSSGKILDSKLISFIVSMYFKNKLVTATTLIGLAGALILLIGYVVSENEERITGREGKLLSGIGFLQSKIATVGGLILLIFFTKTYYGTFNEKELTVFLLLIIIYYAIWLHFSYHINHVYDWETIEHNEYKIRVNIILGQMAFWWICLLFYIYSLQYVNTIIYNSLNIWILFYSLIGSASFKYPLTKKIIVRYSDNKKEYAHLVRIENGFARIITKECISKQVNLNEIAEMNYDKDYIENFRKNIS